MKTNNMYKKELRFPYALSIKSVMLCALILLGIQTPMQAQDSIQYTKPSWFFGVAAGGNINFYRGSTQKMDDGLTVPTTFNDGSGVGLFLAPLIEYRPATSRWGIMLQVGYDSRKGSFDGVNTPCNCPADLITDLSYLTVEPSLRLAPFKSNFYLYGGPRLAFNMSKGYKYQLGINPAYPDQLPTAEQSGDFSDIRSNLISMQIGAGYDIPLSSQSHKTQFVLSPFVSFQPYFGQDPRTIETWNVTTLRVGAALKLGTEHKVEKAVAKEVLPERTVIADPKVEFIVTSPKNVQTDNQVREIFPLRNYVFFDAGSSKIPNRYVQLNKAQAQDFREDELSMRAPQNPEGRSDRQMIVYYNILNIIGDRMVKNPTTTIMLVGSSEQGNNDGREMALSVKGYLVTTFAIDPKRIAVEGRVKPLLPSTQIGATKELVLLSEGDRRVSIETSSPALLMEFQNGPDAAFKPIDINVAPLDSNITFNADGAKDGYTSWSMEIADNKGKVQYYGPYTQDKVSIAGSTILGNTPEGDYTVKMIGTTREGKVITKETTSHFILWKAPLVLTGTRYSILYEFNNSKSITMYHKYLINVVMPKIPNGGTVIIHGHADVIGDDIYNQKLSLNRANDVKDILAAGLKKAGRTDVKFDVHGYGEDEKMAPFENKYPEERFYNRTVIIDIAQ
ncbi:MAG: outer membrane beta-barrel protein [Paludibacter sp.]